MDTEPLPLASSETIDPRWGLTQRVVDSKGFQHCPKLRAFLLYVSENALLGRVDDVCEQMIGSRVYGRPPNYNTSEDTIVRTEAWKLRKRLDAYFAEEGRNEPIVIEMPKGGYVPRYRPREQPAPEVFEPIVQEAREAPPAPEEARGRRRLTPVLATALVIAVAAIVWLGTENWRLRHPSGPVARARGDISGQDHPFYRELLGPMATSSDRETLLVLSNPKVVLFFGAKENTPGPHAPPSQTIEAPKELRGRFREAMNNSDRNAPFQFLRYTREDYTGMGEALSALQIDRLMRSLQRTVRVTQGRFLNWEHMPKQDLILLGAPQINDWTYHNVFGSNFNPAFLTIENAKPLPGELKEYRQQSEPGESAGRDLTDYGVIKMLTSPYGFRMLLVFGLNSAGTAGAGDFFTNPEKMKPVYDRIRAASAGQPFPATWEVLIKIEVRDSVPVSTSAVAVRPVR